MEMKSLSLYILILAAEIMAQRQTPNAADQQIINFRQDHPKSPSPPPPSNPAGQQIVDFRKRHPNPIGTAVTGSGKPVEYHEATNTLNEKIIHNEFFLELLLHLDRERIPERVVHAKAAGAFGYFEVTHNITDICKAKLFSHVGKRTPIAARFSPVAIERGGIDTSRENRGFAVKFYTEEGNWDFVGLNIPIFQIKDPLFFPLFAHAVKRNPATNLLDPNTFWDVFSYHPESLQFLLWVFGDRGIPDGYRHMSGFSIHTYQLVNSDGESFFVRFTFTPDAGVRNILSQRAKCLAAEDPDYATKDLYNAIAEGRYPSWSGYIQVLNVNDVLSADFDVFDVTRILPEDKYPLRPFGRIVLNRNPINYFAEVEQLAYGPGNVVPGILGAPDQMFEARRLSYKDAHNYRLGGNFFNIPVNCPLNRKNTYTYVRDGDPPVNDNQRDVPNYYPNSFNGPEPYHEKNRARLIEIYQDPPYNLDQSKDLYYSFSQGEKNRLVENVVTTLKLATSIVQDRIIHMFGTIDVNLGNNMRRAVQNSNITIPCN